MRPWGRVGNQTWPDAAKTTIVASLYSCTLALACCSGVGVGLLVRLPSRFSLSRMTELFLAPFASVWHKPINALFFIERGIVALTAFPQLWIIVWAVLTCTGVLLLKRVPTFRQSRYKVLMLVIGIGITYGLGWMIATEAVHGTPPARL